MPEYSGTQMRLYSNTPIADLTSIDFAPETGYARDMIQATPGYGYVFEIVEGTSVRYGALRVTHVGHRYRPTTLRRFVSFLTAGRARAYFARGYLVVGQRNEPASGGRESPGKDTPGDVSPPLA